MDLRPLMVAGPGMSEQNRGVEALNDAEAAMQG